MKNLTTQQLSELRTRQYFKDAKNPIDYQLQILAGINKGQLPNGSYTLIAKLTGTSRQRVEQRAKKLNLIPIHKTDKYTVLPLCIFCKGAISKSRVSKFCSYECRKKYNLKKYWIKRICKIDKKVFYVRRGLDVKGLYCSKHCWGVYIGRTYGSKMLNLYRPNRTRYIFTSEFLRQHIKNDPFCIEDFRKAFDLKYVTAQITVSQYRLSGIIQRTNKVIGKKAFYEII